MTQSNPRHPWLAAILREHLAGIKQRDGRGMHGAFRVKAGRKARAAVQALFGRDIFNVAAPKGRSRFSAKKDESTGASERATSCERTKARERAMYFDSTTRVERAISLESTR